MLVKKRKKEKNGTIKSGTFYTALPGVQYPEKKW